MPQFNTEGVPLKLKLVVSSDVDDLGVCLSEPFCPVFSLATDKKKTKELVIKNAPAVAAGVKKAAEKHKKSGGWLGFLSNAASVAADLVPPLLPFLLANHSSTMGAARANPAAFSGAPLAVSGTLGSMAGLKSLKATSSDARGNVKSVRVRTMDYVTALPSSAFNAGDVVLDAYLTPQDPLFQGTKFAEYGSMYERYKIHSAVLIYEPTVPATTTGALSGCVFDDPVVDVPNLGIGEGIRVVTSQMGGETWQVWNAGCFSAPKSKDWLFLDPAGGDVRWCVAGRIAIVASTAVAGGVTPGNLYLASDTEYYIPSLADSASPGDGFIAQDSVTNAAPVAYQPFVTVTLERAFFGGAQIWFRATQDWHEAGVARAGNTLAGLPAGDYYTSLKCTGTTVTGNCNLILTDEAVASGVEWRNAVDWKDTAFTTTAGVFNVLLSVPPGIGSAVPILGFKSLTAVTQTAAYFRIFLINEGFSTFDAYPSVAARKRAQFYARTSQGIQSNLLAKVNRLASVAPVQTFVPIPATSISAAVTSLPYRRP